MLKTLVLSIFLCLTAIGFAPNPAKSEVPHYSQYGHMGIFCISLDGVIAWAPALVVECAEPIEGETLSRQRARALEKCENALVDFRPRVPDSLQCRLAFDGERISDEEFRQLALNPPPFDVNLKIKQKGERTRHVRGNFREVPWPYEGEYLVPFVVNSEGSEICRGEYYLGVGLKIEALCFGLQHKGTALTRKLIKSQGMYFLAPKKVKVKTRGGYVELEFE